METEYSRSGVGKIFLGFAFFSLAIWTLLDVYLLFGDPSLDAIRTITYILWLMRLAVFLFIILAINELLTIHRERTKGGDAND